jgi:PAS domain S-box-containing protein
MAKHMRGERTELAAILASTHDAVVRSTRLGVIKSWNPAAADLYGYSAEEIIGRNTELLVAPEGREEEAERVRGIVRGEPTGQYRAARIAKDGSRIAVVVTTSVIVSAANAVLGVVTVSRRLNEPLDTQDGHFVDRRHADEGQDRLLAQLHQRERMEVLGRLAGGVAHDFNNLLGVILNYAAFVSEELGEEFGEALGDEVGAGAPPDWELRCQVAQRDVGQIQRAAERATDLTHRLLAFARREVVQAQVLNLNATVLGVEELLRRTLGADVALIITLAEDVWPILADSSQIEQVLVNLAINASDAMPGGGTLRIDTGNVGVDADSVAGGSPAQPGRYVRLRVSDTGSGMSAEVVNHAFEPFFTTKGEGAGTGLGLATVYGIITQAEATIAIQSELDVGTTFTIMLPATDEAARVSTAPAPYHRAPKGETVLVVEDEEALREVTERIFTRNGYRVLTAANGADAIALVARYEGEIHLLVTDVVMPRMLGKEVADRVRELRPHIQVLYMSGYAQPVLASQGRLEPGVALVDKPFSEAALLAKAAQVLDGHFRGYETVAPSS